MILRKWRCRYELKDRPERTGRRELPGRICGGRSAEPPCSPGTAAASGAACKRIQTSWRGRRSVWIGGPCCNRRGRPVRELYDKAVDIGRSVLACHQDYSILLQEVKQAYRFVDDPFFHLSAAVLDRRHDCYRFARIGLAVFARCLNRRRYVV